MLNELNIDIFDFIFSSNIELKNGEKKKGKLSVTIEHYI